MKLLMFHAPSFWYRPHEETPAATVELNQEDECRDAIVAFYQAEQQDIGREAKVITKWVKNIKWLARKFQSRKVVLHSFNHLSTSKAPPEVTREMAQQVRDRLERVDFIVTETPFGYQNEWKMHVSGESLAKVFKDI